MMRVLAYVEDPGAANWIGPLVKALPAEEVDLFARGAALAYLRDRGMDPKELEPTVAADDLIRRCEPEVVVTGTSENLTSLGLDLIDAARIHGIPSAAPVDQAANAQHRFRGSGEDPRRHAPDLVLVADTETADALYRLGFADDAVVVTGNPHHNRVRAVATELDNEGRDHVRARLFPDAKDRPVAMFLAEIGYVVNPEAERWNRELNFTGRDGSAPRCARMLEEWLDALALLPQRPYVVLRLHPKNEADEFAAYAGEIDLVNEGGDPLPFVWAADLVTGMSSSLLEEAQIMGRPCLSILPHTVERNWLSGLRSGKIPTVESRMALQRALATSWTNLMGGSHGASDGAASAMASAIRRLAVNS